MAEDWGSSLVTWPGFSSSRLWKEVRWDCTYSNQEVSHCCGTPFKPLPAISRAGEGTGLQSLPAVQICTERASLPQVQASPG